MQSKYGNVEIKDFYCNQYLGKERHIGIKVIKIVIKYKLDLLFTFRVGEISFHMLKDSFVDIYKIDDELSVKEVIDKYNAGELEPIIAPTHPVEESQVEKRQNFPGKK